MAVSSTILRLRALKIYALRLLLAHFVTKYFISGDGIAKLCDYEPYPPRTLFQSKVNIAKLKVAKSIFVPGHMVDYFLLNFSEEISANVLVFGNSDRDYMNLELMLPKSVRRVFLQNSHIDNEKYSVLPIGVENLRYGKNGFKRYFTYKTEDQDKVGRILVGPFSATHAERLELLEWKWATDERVYFQEEFMSNREISSLSRKFKFVACPRGNGTDTHRFWETLYRGSIPVVLDTVWSRQIQNLGIPCLLVPNWKIDSVLAKMDSSTIAAFNPSEVAPLWLRFWEDKIRSDSE